MLGQQAEPHEEAMALAFRGFCRLQQDRPGEALEVFRTALSAGGTTPDPMVLGNVLPGMAAAAGRLGDIDSAVEWCREAVAVSEALRAADGFEIDIGHVTLVGRCRDCADRG